MIDYNIGWVPASQFRIDTVTYEIRGPIHGKNLPIEWVPKRPEGDDLLGFIKQFAEECRRESLLRPVTSSS